MNHLREDELDPDEYHPSGDREISLGTSTILGIFFAIALVCACFFGFGYSMGRKSAPPAVALDAPPAATLNAPKPAAGSPAGAPAATASDFLPQTPPPLTATPTAPTATIPLSPSKNATTAADAMIVGDKPPAVPAPQLTTNNQQPAASYVVQVAAVSSQDVADILISSLQKKGYTVAVRHEPQDKLLHVQIGPFPDRPAADAMRARVLADGFNAIVK